MNDDYRPEPKFVRTESLFSMLSYIPALSAVIFSATAYIFIVAGDPKGSKTFLVISLFSAVVTIILSFIAVCMPRKKKIFPLICLLLGAIVISVVFIISPDILQNLNFWSATGEDTEGPFIP